MARTWHRLRGGGRQGQGSDSPAEVTSAASERYLAEPARPLPQLAVRVGLWAAVGLGCVGGLVGLLRPSAGASEPVVLDEDEDQVPAAVTRVAEVAVEEWLAATEDNAERLDDFFVEQLDLDEVLNESLEAERVTAVTARELDEGYWSVTVAVDIVELVGRDESDTDGADDVGDGDEDADEEELALDPDAGPDDPEVVDRQRSTWFVELGIVGDPGRGMAALSTPAIVPPPAVDEGWNAQGERLREPDEDDPLADSVHGFLHSLLLGGDPSRYVTPGYEVDVLETGQFVAVELEGMADEPLADGGITVWAEVLATTPGGSTQRLAYELVLDERDGRWEVSGFWGTPSLSTTPADEELSGDEPTDGEQ